MQHVALLAVFLLLAAAPLRGESLGAPPPCPAIAPARPPVLMSLQRRAIVILAGGALRDAPACPRPQIPTRASG